MLIFLLINFDLVVFKFDAIGHNHIMMCFLFNIHAYVQKIYKKILKKLFLDTIGSFASWD